MFSPVQKGVLFPEDEIEFNLLGYVLQHVTSK